MSETEINYIEELIVVFEGSVSNYPELGGSQVRDELRLSIEAKKYDLQDQGLIEAILKDDREDLSAGLIETLDHILSNLEEGASKADYLASEEAKKEAINTYITSLEHLINLYYNNIIGKQFSST